MKPILGFLSADLHQGASTTLWSAVVEEARRQGVPLICFPGGRLGQEPETMRNRVYDLAGPGCLDAVITWASSLGGTSDEVQAFHERLVSLPLVSLSHKLPGVPVIRIDAYAGMRQLIDHLVEDHGLRRVAFVRGPAEHQSAQLRFQAYQDALAHHGIDVDDALVVGPLRWDAGAEAVRVLLDERELVLGRDVVAIVTASDLLAFGAFQALRDRNIRVPQDVVLTGFNGTVESVLSQPHLTTVHLPFEVQGREAVRAVLSHGEGEDLVLPTRLLIRESCGCPSRSRVLAGSPTDDGDAPLDALRDRWMGRVAALGDFAPDALDDWLRPFAEALLQDLTLRAARPRCLEVLEQALEHGEGTAWQDAVSLLRTTLSPALPADQRTVLDTWADQCRVTISTFVEQRARTRAWEESQRAEALREAGRRLSAAWTIAELTEALDAVLPRLGVPGAWLVLTEQDEARLVWCRREGLASGLAADGLRFFPEQLIPPTFLPEPGAWCLVVQPLSFQSRSVGYAVFQTGPLDGALYEELRSDLCSALKGIFLVAEARRARQVAEKADQIKTRLLANVSHELRTPLTQILAQVRGSGAGADLTLIQANAEHQLRLINDLLDLSRAEIDELDLAREVLDPVPLLREVFESFRSQARGSPVEWQLNMGDLPLIAADPLRLRQVFLNLLSNAAKFTQQGRIELGARAEPPHLHLWVRDSGPGIAPEVRDRLFQPFVTGAQGGIGLGLSIARHLVALHWGTLEAEPAEGGGTVFHARLPLPNLEDSVTSASGTRQPALLALSRRRQLPPDLQAWVEREGLEVLWLDLDGELPLLETLQPRCVYWDQTGAQPRDWALVRQLRHHAALFRAPFLLYGGSLTALVDKADPGASLRLAIEAACPPGGDRPLYVVDDEEAVRSAVVSVAAVSLPGYPVRTFGDAESAWAALADEVPAAVVLDFSLPGWDGATLLEKMRGDARLRLVPVLLLSNKVFSTQDLARIDQLNLVTLQAKGVWTASETGDRIRQLLGGVQTPVPTSALVKRALAYMTRHYRQDLARWQVAEEVSVSEDYLSRVFSREMGLSPWDFLTRYRIHQACRLLEGTSDSIRAIAAHVGFHDQAYFSRVFRKVMHKTPQDYRLGG